jgi:hypothetical protein
MFQTFDERVIGKQDVLVIALKCVLRWNNSVSPMPYLTYGIPSVFFLVFKAGQ